MVDIEPFVHRMFDDVGTYGHPVSDLRVNCPFCLERYGKDDNNKKLHISLDKRTVHCFKCEYSRSWVGFVMDIVGCTYAQALGEIYVRPNPAQFENILDSQAPVKLEAPSDVRLPEGLILLSDKANKLPMLVTARNYMRKRNVMLSHWKAYNVGILPDKMPYRVVIPVEGDYYQARAIFKYMKPRYLGPKVDDSNMLFNAGVLETYDEVVICEGIFSAWAIGNNALALLGSNGNIEGKLERLIDSAVTKFIITVESGAHKKMSMLAHHLASSGKDIELWVYEGDDDPADGKAAYSLPYDFAANIRQRLTGKFV